MSDCCSSTGHPTKASCPLCAGEGAEVATWTSSHHLRQSCVWPATAGRCCRKDFPPADFSPADG